MEETFFKIIVFLKHFRSFVDFKEYLESEWWNGGGGGGGGEGTCLYGSDKNWENWFSVLRS